MLSTPAASITKPMDLPSGEKRNPALSGGALRTEYNIQSGIEIEARGSAVSYRGMASTQRSIHHVFYLGVVSVLLHNFWAAQGVSAGVMQSQFLKNVRHYGRLANDCGPWSRMVRRKLEVKRLTEAGDWVTSAPHCLEAGKLLLKAVGTGEACAFTAAGSSMSHESNRKRTETPILTFIG
jgi:hypothetical protein